MTSTSITRNPKNGFILSLKEWFKKKTFAENKNSESSRFMKGLRNGYYKISDKIVYLKQNSYRKAKL